MFESAISLTINTRSKEVHDAIWARFQKIGGELCRSEGLIQGFRLSPDSMDLSATVSEDFGSASHSPRFFPLV